VNDDGNKSIEYNDDYNNILSSTAHHRHRIRSSLRFFTLDKERNYYCYYRRVRLTYVTTAGEKL
jgi:hypothetical protein